MSIRLRLTLLYSAILALTLIAFSTILFVTQTHFTYDTIRTNLMRQADGIANGPRRLPSGFGQPPGSQSGEAPPPGTLPGRWTQARSLDGTVVSRTYDLAGADLPLSARGLQAVQKGSGWFETAQFQDQPLLIYSRPLQSSSGTAQILQVAAPIGEREQSLHTLGLILIIGCSIAILAAFAIGWILAGASLSPIERITHTAAAIGAEHDFSRRVEHAGPNDEVGQLATTFNTMLAELEVAYRGLENALDTQRRFVADASHELRTPLTTVRGNMELLRREPPIEAAERVEILSDTTEEVDRLIRLVNQLLVLARADAGQNLPLVPVPLKPLLEDVYRQAKLLGPGRHVCCDPTEDVQVLANRDALKQVLLVLVDNALVHTGYGATIELSAATSDGHTAINVRDTGPGIAPEVLPHIFDRFYRGQISRTGKGTGLGLAIAKELVNAQNGRIAVNSTYGQGTVFTVTLPLASN